MKEMRKTKRDAKNNTNSNLPQSSVFNLLNNRNGKLAHELTCFERINIPGQNKKVSGLEYNEMLKKFKDGIREVAFTTDYINSLLELMEATLSYVPSCTNANEIPDISLYDHSKTTAAIASCIYEYLNALGKNDYRNILYENGKDFYKEKAFLMFSFDISGIQKFIYTISSKNALKMLRARSFYLEVLSEHLIDRLLINCGLSRANLIYSGGGHCYILLPNTEKVKKEIDNFLKTVNRWLIEKFGNSLYVAVGKTECSANDLMNTCADDNSKKAEATNDYPPYKDIFVRVGREQSRSKLNRYDAYDIRRMNNLPAGEIGRECRVCG